MLDWNSSIMDNLLVFNGMSKGNDSEKLEQLIVNLSVSSKDGPVNSVSNNDYKLTIEPIPEEVTHFVAVTDKKEVTHIQRLLSMADNQTAVVHELNNLFCALYGNLQLCELADKNQKRYLSEAMMCLDRMKKYLGSKLSMAHKPEYQFFDIHKALDEAIILSNPYRKESSAEVIKDYSPFSASLYCLGSPTDIFLNLFKNSYQAFDGDSGWAKLMIKTEICQSNIVVVCSDNGKGISKKYLNKIWDPYFTTKKNGHGTGFGLHLVRERVKECNGSIEVSSEEGEGTTFTLTFLRSGKQD